jgi:hypothetical protein
MSLSNAVIYIIRCTRACVIFSFVTVKYSTYQELLITEVRFRYMHFSQFQQVNYEFHTDYDLQQIGIKENKLPHILFWASIKMRRKPIERIANAWH